MEEETGRAADKKIKTLIYKKERWDNKIIPPFML